MIREIESANLDEVISFVVRLNQDLTHTISYFGDTEEEIGADFAILQPPAGYGFVATSDEGHVSGFLGVEMDLELGRSWLFGPLVDHQDWDAIADQLYGASLSARPSEVTDQELFCHTQNTRVQEFAARHGFTFHAEGAVLTLDLSKYESQELFDIVEFDETYSLQLATLHAELFPNTYYSAEQLINLSKEDDKTLLIHLNNGNLAGYVFIQARPASRDSYLDFVGVSQGYRRQGIGRALVLQAVEWAVVRPYVDKITLTVNNENEGAINLYHSLGFVTETVSRAYRKRV
jgi:ribosomal protein S18 acetylase RimI-like enzyme